MAKSVESEGKNMARQNAQPVTFNRTIRTDRAVAMTSARAGKVVPVAYVPLLAGDAASGRVGIDIELQEMPRPLLNGVVANIQAWVVPKAAHPQFMGYDEYMHARTGELIKTLGAADRTPPDFFDVATGADVATFAGSDFAKALGLHVPASADINTDLIDAFNLVYNFRLAAHSSKLTRREYASENMANATALPRAFWPKSTMTKIVPDYEAALIKGNLSLDVSAGQLAVQGIGMGNAPPTATAGGGSIALWSDNTDGTTGPAKGYTRADQYIYFETDSAGVPLVVAEMAGSTIGTTLADIDKARTTQAFAKLRETYAGNDATGFANDDTLVAMLMSGLRVPDDVFKRPILLNQKQVGFGFTERYATDAANLDDSVTQGRVSAMLSLNVPEMLTEAQIVITVEVVPEFVQEAQSDEWLLATSVSDLPDALRDVQRTEPVDVVLNRRRDARHTTPSGAYGYEPMNEKWNRDYQRLGGAFYQANPAVPVTDQRSAVWMPGIIDPAFTADHWLVPDAFPHDVFSDTLADAFECVVRHDVKISGLTQIGDVLSEDNNNYAEVQS